MNYLVTGGCGFIGSHLVKRLLKEGHNVAILDNLSRPGSRETQQELLRKYHPQVLVFNYDLHNGVDVGTAFDVMLHRWDKIDGVVHLAAQVAVTTSVRDPIADMHSNIEGTVILLEQLKRLQNGPLLIFNSTNKVYGKLEQVTLEQNPETKCYRPSNPKYMFGVREDEPLDFYSPYGCSKGAADQYVHDYNRIYGMPTTVLRCSCIAGTDQYGVEDQGWVAWLTIAAMLRKQVNVYGDGNQVRDVLSVDDLVDLYLMCFLNKDKVAGQVYNIGGGFRNQLSVNQLITMLKGLGFEFAVDYDDCRPGDQRWYCSYIEKITKAIAWEPLLRTEVTVERIVNWVSNNEGKIRTVLPKKVLNA